MITRPLDRLNIGWASLRFLAGAKTASALVVRPMRPIKHQCSGELRPGAPGQARPLASGTAQVNPGCRVR